MINKLKVSGLEVTQHPSGAFIVNNRKGVKFTLIQRGHGTQVIRYRESKEPFTLMFSLNQEEWLFKYLREAL